MEHPLDEYQNLIVVLDTCSAYLYIGTLEKCDDMFVTLRDAAVVDCSESKVTREQQAFEIKRFGLPVSRKRVKVKFADVVSVSRLDDVVES